MSAILGALAGLAIGYVTVRLYQWWEWRNAPHEAYYAPMSTTPPTMCTTRVDFSVEGLDEVRRYPATQLREDEA